MKNVRICCAFLVVFSLCFASAAWASPRTLIGSWDARAVSDSDGAETASLWTASRGGTVVLSADNVNFSGAHGVFEKVGPRTFEVRNLAFGYGPDGGVAFILDTTSIVEISRDGDSFTATFTSEVKAPDGTVIAVETGTGTATRIDLH